MKSSLNFEPPRFTALPSPSHTSVQTCPKPRAPRLAGQSASVRLAIGIGFLRFFSYSADWFQYVGLGFVLFLALWHPFLSHDFSLCCLARCFLLPCSVAFVLFSICRAFDIVNLLFPCSSTLRFWLVRLLRGPLAWGLRAA